MSKERILGRLEALRKGYAEKQAEFAEIQARLDRARLDLAAQEGAIQDCEWAVEQLTVIDETLESIKSAGRQQEDPPLQPASANGAGTEAKKAKVQP